MLDRVRCSLKHFEAQIAQWTAGWVSERDLSTIEYVKCTRASALRMKKNS